MTTKKALQVALGLSMAAFFLWLTLNDIGVGQMQRALAKTNLHGVLFAFAAVSAGYSCRVQRWRLMLMHANPRLGWSECAGPFLASFAANNLLPFRAGDVMRAFAFRAELRATPGVVLATVVVERMLDLLIILAAFGAALGGFDVSSPQLVGAGGVVFLGIATAVAFVLVRPRVLIPVLQMAANYAGRSAPTLGRAISEELTKSAATFEHLAGRVRLTRLLLWSALAWLLEGCAFWFAAMAIPSLVAPAAAWLALPVSALATLVPSTPGYVGTFDYFTALAMRVVGNDATSAAVYAFLVHVTVWFPSTVLGSAYLVIRFVGRRARGGSSAD